MSDVPNLASQLQTRSSCKILRDATPKSLVILDGMLPSLLNGFPADPHSRIGKRYFYLCKRRRPFLRDSLLMVLYSGRYGNRWSMSHLHIMGFSDYDLVRHQAVLHEIATRTLPLAFFATHYGSLTDDFAYHPNIRNMHMSTMLDDEKHEASKLYTMGCWLINISAACLSVQVG